jgi:hypothetical protein
MNRFVKSLLTVIRRERRSSPRSRTRRTSLTIEGLESRDLPSATASTLVSLIGLESIQLYQDLNQAAAQPHVTVSTTITNDLFNLTLHSLTQQASKVTADVGTLFNDALTQVKSSFTSGTPNLFANSAVQSDLVNLAFTDELLLSSLGSSSSSINITNGNGPQFFGLPSNTYIGT